MNGKCSDAIRYLGRQASRTHNYFLCLRGSFFSFLQRYILRILRYKLWLLFYCYCGQGGYFFLSVTSEKSEFIFNFHQIYCQA